jgi:hypothetical protein
VGTAPIAAGQRGGPCLRGDDLDDKVAAVLPSRGIEQIGCHGPRR